MRISRFVLMSGSALAVWAGSAVPAGAQLQPKSYDATAAAQPATAGGRHAAAPRNRSGNASGTMQVAQNSVATQPQQAGSSGPGRPGNAVEEVVVTAQKRSQSINKVGESITAVSGAQLLQQGITDTAQLSKVVPGFNFTQSAYATPVYTIRGVGFQESSLAASPAVTVYVDEIPLPFPIETEAAGLDLQRVEVLKGPQGTLFGENSTGGAVNYIAAKPTDTFKAGLDASFGRFDTGDVAGFVSGPLAPTLNGRAAFRVIESGDYQKSYTSSATLGAKDQIEGRVLLDWRPVDRLKVTVNLNAWRDESDTPASQLISISPAVPGIPLNPAFANYPPAPANDRAAGFDPGVNFHRNNIYSQASTREDYDFGNDLILTSITAYERLTRNQPFDQDGTPFQDVLGIERGSITTVNQELRLAGHIGDKGHWLAGGNYESDDVSDNGGVDIADSTTAHVPGLSFNRELNFTKQAVKTYAAFGNLDYEIAPSLTLQGGARFTQSNRSYVGCAQDSGNGQLATAFEILQAALKGPANVVPIARGGCITLGPTLSPELVRSRLDQNNVSWKTGLNWQAQPGLLLYANVSRGYKAGSYPTLGASSYVQDNPVTQERVIAYEAGFKASLLDHMLQLNGAGFYDDYKNKQIRGYFADQIFGALESLVNIPQSHVAGFELSADFRPIEGLTISPAVTLVNTQIDGKFTTFTPLLTRVNVSGEPFPYTPKWQTYVTAEYRRPVSDRLDGFFGLNATYQSGTNGGVGAIPIYNIRPYTLLDLRAGVETPSAAWRFTVWGRNVTDQYYWTYAGRNVDVNHRYAGYPATYGATLSYRFQ